MAIEEAIKAEGARLGFDQVGIAAAEPSAFAAEYREWLAAGHAGEMEYLSRNVERRLDPRQLLEGAQSIVVVAMNYYCDADEGPGSPRARPDRALFARYARGDDYHEVMGQRLTALLSWLQQRLPGTEGRIYVDAGPVLEREVARRAGIGWFGKNTLLINTGRGSYFFLGEIVTTAALAPDNPAVGGCGSCTRCIDACPTGAIIAPYRLDARRCLSYLTIELKGALPDEMRPAVGRSGNRVFGCDICQEVCPFNLRRSEPTAEPAYQARSCTRTPRLSDLMTMTQEDFTAAFKGSPVKRAKRRGLLRNVAAALSASDEPDHRAALEAALKDAEPLVREEARQALLESRLSPTGADGNAMDPRIAPE